MPPLPASITVLKIDNATVANTTRPVTTTISTAHTEISNVFTHYIVCLLDFHVQYKTYKILVCIFKLIYFTVYTV